MAKDAYGNYVVGVSESPVFPLPTSIGGSGGAYTGDFDDPNTNIVPDDPTGGAWYYQGPSNAPYNVWYWDVATQAWIQYSVPA